MRWLLFALLFCFHLSKAQKIDVRLENAVHDFGYIKEADGKVFVDISFKNYSNIPIRVEKVISSCGCAVADTKSEWIKKDTEGKIRFSYDPTGRPGKFVKSFEIIFASDSLKQTLYFNIKGHAIEKELLETYVDDLYEGTQLMIKPYSAELISGSDFRFLEDQKFQHFINDITYEIDQNGFANIKLQTIVETETECKYSKDIYSVAHKYIISELKRRNYDSWMVGFTDEKCALTKGDTHWEPGLKLIISSRDYNNDTIQESGFYFSGKSLHQNEQSLIKIRDSIENEKKIALQFALSDIKFLQSEKNKDYEKYLNHLNRKILIDDEVRTGFSVSFRCRADDRISIEKKLMEEVRKIQLKLQKDAEETGADPSKIIFAVPEFNFIADSTYKSGKFKKHAWQLSIYHNEKTANLNAENPFTVFVESDSLQNNKLKDFLMQTGFKSPMQNLPVYQSEHTGQFFPDKENKYFKKWFEIVSDEIKTGKKMRFIIESSTGRNPQKKEQEMEIFSRKNAEKMKAEIKSLLKSNGIADSLYSIEIVSALVQGASNSSKEMATSFNSVYNYVKVIPVVNVSIDKSTKQIPYQINFGNNSFSLPVNTSVFQNFISRIAMEIEQKGYISLIIESSSSKIPSTVYKSNTLLSFYRSEEAESKLREEIRKRGYDASRLIISEKRNLVQGPEFKSEADRKKYDYQKYQYVKIIPLTLIID